MVDEELDTDELVVDVVVLNRAPTFNLTHPVSVEVENPITVEAVDIEDVDTSSPSGQRVVISWPGLTCAEGLTQPTCTFTPMFEGPVNITAVATDDDGDTVLSEVMVLNVPPTISPRPSQKVALRWCRMKTERGASTRTNSGCSKQPPAIPPTTKAMIVEWFPSLADENWTHQRGRGVTAVGLVERRAHRQVRAIDADGATSDIQQNTVMVHNVPPTVQGLPGNSPVVEDDPLNLTVWPKTASDQATLTICWDLNAKLDTDGDGVRDNDAN